MRARWPDDVAILQALALEIDDLQRHRLREQAREIANEIADLIGRSS